MAPELGDETPAEAVRAGRADEVRAAAGSYLTG